MDKQSYTLGYLQALSDLELELFSRKKINSDLEMKNRARGYEALSQVYNNRYRELKVVSDLIHTLKGKKEVMELFPDNQEEKLK